MADLFGWDLVYRVSESSIAKKEDNLVLLVHFLLIKNGFKCLGLGDSKGPEQEEKGSELLPAGWSDSTSYSIRYICDKQSFVLRGVPVNNSIVFNLLDTKSLAVSNVALMADNEIKEQNSDLSTLFTNHECLIKKITDNLITPVKEHVSKNREATTQTPDTSSTSRHYNLEPVPDLVINPQRPGSASSVFVDPLRDPLRIGGADLDPLGGLGGFEGGGMLFDPFSNRQFPDNSGLPRGSVPPGARFDPFAPPGAAPGPRRPNRGPPDFDGMDPFGGIGRRPFGGGHGGPPMFM